MRSKDIFLKELSKLVRKTIENKDTFDKDERGYGSIATHICLDHISDELNNLMITPNEILVADKIKNIPILINFFQKMKFEVGISIHELQHMYEAKEMLYNLRRCKTWEDIMALEENFIELYSKLENNNIYKILNKNNDTWFFYYLYTMYLILYGIYAINDVLYSQLDVKCKDAERIKYDYLNNGMPLSTSPVMWGYDSCDFDSNVDIDENKKRELVDMYIDLINTCEKEVITTGTIPANILASTEYISVITSCTRVELSSSFMSRNKFRKTLREYINLTETTALALYEVDLDITNEDYINVATFNEEYKRLISNIHTPEELTKAFDKNIEKFEELTSGIKDAITKFGDNLLSMLLYYDLRDVLVNVDVSLYMQKSELLVMMHHMGRVRDLAKQSFSEKLAYELELYTSIFSTTENRLKEIKKEIAQEGQKQISVKSTTKKLAKYKKIFDFKKLNKLAMDAGYSKIRQKGDHAVFKKIDGTVVVIPQGRTIGKGLSYEIQRDIERCTTDIEEPVRVAN